MHFLRRAHAFLVFLKVHRARELHLARRMGFRNVEEIHAYQLTRAFKLEFYRLIRASPDARSDFRFKSQVYEALSGAESNIAERPQTVGCR